MSELFLLIKSDHATYTINDIFLVLVALYPLHTYYNVVMHNKRDCNCSVFVLMNNINMLSLR